jgi:hypothetical protein
LEEVNMKRSALLRLAVAATALMAIERVNASSAVAMDPVGHITRAYDPTATEESAKQAALELAVRRGWLGARIIASSGRYGYCAIALGRKGHGAGSIMGIALGRRSQAEADLLAIGECHRGGGVNPKVYARFKG